MKSILRKVHDLYESLQLLEAMVGWLLVPPMLLGLGVSQAVYGWMGNSFLLRVIYPICAISFGLGIGFFILWCCTPVSADAPQLAEETMSATLRRLAEGRYGQFELNATLRRELRSLHDIGYVTLECPLEELPSRGAELCDHVKVRGEVKQFFDSRATPTA